jgi:hypothetical protein
MYVVIGVGFADAALPERPIGELLGIVHAGGKYSLPTRSPACDYLNEGADRIADLGSRTIKVWLTPSSAQSYPNFSGNHPWPATPASLKLMLQTSYFQELLARPEFTTYIFVASEFVPKETGGYTTTSWKDGLSAFESSAVTAQFQEVAAWLLTAYAGSGKTFIFQNWEGDNALNLELLTPSDQKTATQGMIDWLRARQLGVTRARAAAPNARNVKVYNAAEINYNPGTNSTFPISEELCMVNAVVPSLNSDLYSWSNWASKSPGNAINVIRGLDYLKARAPASAAFGHDNIYMGEFGVYESSSMGASAPYHSAASDLAYSRLIDEQLAYAWRWGAIHAVQWACYDNGLRKGYNFDPNQPVSVTEDKLVGTWLVRACAVANDPSSYSFTTAYGRLARLSGRVLHDDPLADTSLASAIVGNFSVTTTPQPWDQEDRARLYRATRGTTTSLTYQTNADIVDWNIRAFVSGASTASGRIRGYTSPDGVSWSAAFDFGEVDVFVPAPVRSPSWRRLHLGPPAAGIPVGTRHLRVELYGLSPNTLTQLGHVRLVTEATAAFEDHLSALGLVSLASGNLVVSTAGTAYSGGDAGRAYRTSTDAGWLTYEAKHIQRLRFEIIHYGATLTGKVATRASYDGQKWTPVALAYDPSVPTSSGWYRTWARTVGELPEGTRFVMFELLDPTHSWNPQIAKVKFDRLP